MLFKGYYDVPETLFQ